ncbi:ATP-binding cassette domain-containing protein [Candidatus Gracilibacteria bacterium]|nr:ATP-binding cassette domain-containing protein [Candidatus Gracilibacteria bacterium]
MLTLHNIQRSIGGNHILNGIDLTAKEGQAIGLVGPNGCGKTSLINVINGFYQASHGSIVFDDKHITRSSVEKRGQMGIGRVFQSFGIFKNLTLFENLALAFVNNLHRKYKFLPTSFLPQEKKDQINSVLHELDLYSKRNELAGNLSGGQMRLLEIARLYIQDTKLFLLDEPTAGVSPKLKGKVIQLLNKIIQTGKTVIIVEHDFEFLGQFVDQIMVMDEGKIVLEGSYQDIKNSDTIKEIYFGRLSDKHPTTSLIKRSNLIKV